MLYLLRVKDKMDSNCVNRYEGFPVSDRNFNVDT